MSLLHANPLGKKRQKRLLNTITMVQKHRTNQAPPYFATYFMIDLVCQEAELKTCHICIYLMQIINWSMLFCLL